MTKVLLIEPGTKLTKFPPLGLLSLAAVMKENNLEPIILDYSGKELINIKQDIENSKANFVGIKVLTGPNITRGLKISKIAKELGKTVIWGGPHPTVLPKQTLENPNIDAVVIGEGEYSILDLIKYLKSKKVKPYGCGIKENNKITILPPPKKFVDLNKLPLPAWDLLKDINNYFPNKNHNLLPISTTRGCAFKCGFCHNSNKNVKEYLGCYRIADPKKAIEEYKFVQSLVKNKIDRLDVGEDLHLVSKEYTKKFCKTMIESKLGLKWYTAARYMNLDLEQVDLIKKAGCEQVLFGVESGSQRIQKMNNKFVDLNHAVKISKALRKRNVVVINAYIFGHPTETKQELKMTSNYLRKLPADENLIQLYRPLPATPYFDISLKRNKIKLPKKLEDWSNFGVLGYDKNVSEINTNYLFKIFYRTNAIEQTKYWLNLQKYHLRNNLYKKFLKTFIINRFTFKLKEYLESKK